MVDKEFKKVSVPDSLDLVERAKLGLNGLLRTLDPECDFEPYCFTFYGAHPEYFVHSSTTISGVMIKFLEAVALLRNMTGTSHLKDLEDGMLKAIIENISEDGLIYDRATEKRPWNTGFYLGKDWNEDYSSMEGDGRLICGMDFYYQLTGNEEWKKRIKRTAEKMLELAIIKDDYAYYPNVGCGTDFGYPRVSGWTHTDEPKGPHEGVEGATAMSLTQPIRGLVRWFKMSGDERMLDLSARLARFVIQPKFWGGMVELNPEHGAQRAHWWWHEHANLAAFRGLIEYAMVAEDYRVMEFVRDGYEWDRQNRCVQLGMGLTIEGCTTGDLVALGIQLSDAGMGDYWDDVDYIVRNSLCEAQTTDADTLKRFGDACAERPKDSFWGAYGDHRFDSGMRIVKAVPGMECTDNVIERSLGGYMNTSGYIYGDLYQHPWQMCCCTANGNQGWFYAWEAIVRCRNNEAVINLLFNRFSSWLDIESYMPYEGKVVIKNKTAKKINIRIPAWIKRSQLKFSINGNYAEPSWVGSYAGFSNLNGSEMLVMEFPLERQTHTMILASPASRSIGRVPAVTATFKGSTCIGTSKNKNSKDCSGACGSIVEDVLWVKLFRRLQYQVDNAPIKETDYYIADKIIKWY